MFRSGRLLFWTSALSYGCFQPHADGFEGKEQNDSGIDCEAGQHIRIPNSDSISFRFISTYEKMYLAGFISRSLTS